MNQCGKSLSMSLSPFLKTKAVKALSKKLGQYKHI